MEELKKEAVKLRGFHTIDLGGGYIIKGSKDTLGEVKIWDYPSDYFKGKDVLDLGAWDGFYSFNAERMGAKSVTALDSEVWNKNIFSGKKIFDICKKIFNSNVKDINMEICDISKEKIGQFDVVLFAGILYHMIHPMVALQQVVDVVKIGGSLFLESHIDLRHNNFPYMRFHYKDKLNNDGSNWWAPNEKCIDEMLELVGCRVDRKIYNKIHNNRIIYYCTKIK